MPKQPKHGSLKVGENLFEPLLTKAKAQIKYYPSKGKRREQSERELEKEAQRREQIPARRLRRVESILPEAIKQMQGTHAQQRHLQSSPTNSSCCLDVAPHVKRTHHVSRPRLSIFSLGIMNRSKLFSRASLQVSRVLNQSPCEYVLGSPLEPPDLGFGCGMLPAPQHSDASKPKP